MSSDYTLTWSFRNRINILIESIKTADLTCPKEIDFCLIDAASNENTILGLREYCSSIKERKIRICESSYRSSLAEAWNLSLMLTNTRYVIYSSSDLKFLKYGWYEYFLEATKISPYVLMKNHSLFCIDKRIIPKIGWWDEKFKAGPHFDPDYMIRASEQNIKILKINNDQFYIHEDDYDTSIKRLQGEVEDRLPMHDFYNEDYFNLKWHSDWPGWRDSIKNKERHMPHPPVNITQVKRLIEEVDQHPSYTKKFESI
jgi:hypothetical protein